MGVFHGVYPNKLDISTGYPGYSPLFTRICKRSFVSYLRPPSKKDQNLSVPEAFADASTKGWVFYWVPPHISTLGMGQIIECPGVGWLTILKNGHNINATLGFTSWNKVSPTGHGAFPGIRPRRTGGSLLPGPIHPSIQSIHASTESTHLSNSIHRFPSHNVPKYSLRIPGSWRWHRHGGKPSTPCSSGSSLSELDLGDKHSIA